ncbi:hypothetical protein [Parathermosynechococcus lividus]
MQAKSRLRSCQTRSMGLTIQRLKNQDDVVRYRQTISRMRCGMIHLNHWMDGQGKRTADLNKYCRVLAKEYPWAKTLNSLARQAMAERAWSAISRFYNNCKQKVKGKSFKRLQTRASVEYKTSGWRNLFNDVVAYEDVQIRNVVKTHQVAKSIVDAAWYQFRQWLDYFGIVFGVVTVAVPPHTNKK